MQRSNITKAHRDSALVMDIMTQLVGLASAIKMMHKQNYRHGDLKPENILVFTNDTNVGVWKIADLGLAKFHQKATHERLVPTSMIGAGTVSYGPPEPTTNSESPRSRLYDIWSMGCMILQLVICLFYGNRALADLNKKTEAQTFKRESSYWQGDSHVFRWNNIKVHKEVLSIIERMDRDFASSNPSTAIGTLALVDLARLVRTRLLVVELPSIWRGDRESPLGYRAQAEDVYEELKKIQDELRRKLQLASPLSASQAKLRVQNGHPKQKLSGPITNDHTDNRETHHSRQPSSARAPKSHVRQSPRNPPKSFIARIWSRR